MSTISTSPGIRTPRAELVAALIERDGTKCQYPGADHELDFTVMSGPQEVTIDHHIPQWFCKQEGWSTAETWDLSNLRLFCKKHNAAKGDLLPNEDGTLPKKPQSKFRFRREKRANRPELCDICDNGHNLASDEVCAACGANARRFPRWAHVKFGECDHAAFWCWVCSITPEMRAGATEMILLGGEGGDE